MVSQYAIFKKPMNLDVEVMEDSYKSAREAVSECRSNLCAFTCDDCGKYNTKKLCGIRGRAESLFPVLQRINPANAPLPF